ncbi:MAG TPA: hypothetical protein VE913_05335, partial [Longimicrobium sp.]|nr:hypothetical protein [Longimicrobium sp.]
VPGWMPASGDSAKLPITPRVTVLRMRLGDGTSSLPPATLQFRPSADGRESAVYVADALGPGLHARRLPPAQARAVLDALARAQRGESTADETMAELRAVGRNPRAAARE